MTFLEMFDSTNPDAIPAGARAVAGYKDGAKSAWPAAGWAKWSATPHLVLTVLADTAADTFDVEYGNAPATKVAAATSARLLHGLWSVVYCGRNNLATVTAAQAAARAPLTPAQEWPAPGVYLWFADPTGSPHLDAPGLPIAPVAVQYLWAGRYDVSACYGTFPEVPTSRPGPIGPPDPMEDHVTSLLVGTTIHVWDRNPDGTCAHWWYDTAERPTQQWLSETLPTPAPAASQ